MTLRPLLLAVLLLPASVHAEVYRWVDANGQLHYTQTPPPKGIAGSYVPPPPPPSASPNQDAINKSFADSQRAAPAEKQAVEHAAAEKVQREAECSKANASLITLDSLTANRLRITEEQFQQRRKEVQDFLATHCR